MILATSIGILIFAAALSVAAYGYYTKDVAKKQSGNKWSWIIWLVSTAVEASTYLAVNGDVLNASIFFLSAICCVYVAWKVWRSSKWELPDMIDLACLIATFLALALWLGYHETWWAHIVAILAIPISFIPISREAWKHPRRERSLAWILWSIADFLTLIAIYLRAENLEKELLYIVVELACHALMWYLVFHRPHKKIRE